MERQSHSKERTCAKKNFFASQALFFGKTFFFKERFFVRETCIYKKRKIFPLDNVLSNNTNEKRRKFLESKKKHKPSN
jgi:hypothetical protein